MSGAETSLSGYDNASQALSYTPGQEQVYLNGILLVRGDDYTATNGTSITGLSALSASDFVQVNCYNNFSVASVPAQNITGTVTNAQLANSAITINGSAISLGGSVTLAGDIESVTATSPLTGGGSTGALTVGIQEASTSQRGSVQLSDSTSTTSSVLAATPTAVKSAYDLANGAIPKTLTTTTGDIIYASGANTPARLGIGSAAQVLSVSGGVPVWSTPSSGALTKISAQTFSGVSSVTFDSVFTSTYKVYFVTMTNLIMSNSGLSNFQFRKAGVTTAASYYGSGIYLPFNYSGYEPVKHYNVNDSKITIFGADNRAGGGSFYASNVGSGAGDEPMIWGSGTIGFGFGGMQTFGGANGSVTTDHDGFIISVTGTMSGTLTVYGVQA
jgi:hypothetical protein